MTIKQQLITGFLAVALIPILCIGVVSFSNAKDELEQAEIHAIQNILDLERSQLTAFLQERKADLLTAQDYFNIKMNLPILNKFSKNPDSPEYLRAKKMLDGQLLTMQAVNGFFNIMLVNPEGEIVYVTNPAHSIADLGNTLPDPGNLAFKGGREKIFFSAPFLNKVEDNRPTMLITVPARDMSGRFIGVIALEVDMVPIYEMLQERVGLGRTGEILIGKKVGDKVIFLSPLRFDQSPILTETVPLGSDTAVPLQEAVQGRGGQGIAKDYRNQDVIAGWRHIPIVDWGMVAKIDMKEASLPIKRLQMLLIYLCFCTLLLGVGVALLISKKISKPIRTLQKGMERVGKGHLDFKVGTDSQDEIGQLSRSFDYMVGDLKTLNRALEERADELARSNEDLEQFTSIASHDLQEPLRKMRSFSSILKEDYHGVLDEDGQGFLDKIQTSSARMQGLIDDLLSLSRVTTQAKSFQSVDLNEVAREVVNDLDDLISRSKGRVEIGALPKIKADRTQIYHLIQNLIGNGLKYQQKDQSPLISVKHVPRENGGVEIRVTDNGIGFDEKYLDRIFKPFQRLHGRQEYAGTGIGLAICDKIVRRHEGQLTATSTPGQGATFIVKLPRDLAKRQKSKTRQPSEA